MGAADATLIRHRQTNDSRRRLLKSRVRLKITIFRILSLKYDSAHPNSFQQDEIFMFLPYGTLFPVLALTQALCGPFLCVGLVAGISNPNQAPSKSGNGETENG